MKIWLILLVSFLQLAFGSQVAIAQASSPETGDDTPRQVQEVTRVTKELLLRLIELERFNLHYRLECDKQPKTRMYRFFAAHESNEALETATNIILSVENAKGIGLKYVSRQAFESAYVCSTIGNSVAGLGSFGEFLSDMARDRRNKKSGLDHHSAFVHMEKSVEDIDRLIARRDQLVEQIRASDQGQLSEILREERHCLTDIRHHCLNEFMQFHRNMIAHSTNKDVFYLANTATNAVYLAADCLFLKGFGNSRSKRYIGAAQITFLSGAPLTGFSPYIAKWAANRAASRAERQVQKFLATESPNVEGHVAHSKELYSSLPAEKAVMLGTFLDRLDLYVKANRAAERIMSSERMHVSHLQKVAHESLVVAPVLALAQVAKGTTGTVGYFGYGRHPSPRNTRISGALGLSGAVTLTASNSFAAAYTGKNLIETVLYERALRKQHQRVEDVVGERLTDLEEIEKQARAM